VCSGECDPVEHENRSRRAGAQFRPAAWWTDLKAVSDWRTLLVESDPEVQNGAAPLPQRLGENEMQTHAAILVVGVSTVVRLRDKVPRLACGRNRHERPCCATAEERRQVARVNIGCPERLQPEQLLGFFED
jgi:hypothetical protein